MPHAPRNLFAASAAVVLVAVAQAADGPPAPRFDLAAADRWQKGDVVTLRFTEEAAFRLTGDRVDGDGRAAGRLPAQNATVGFGGRYVMRCEEVDATGAWTRATVHVADWHHDTPRRRDAGLAGAFVEVTRDGWALLGSSQNPSPEARRWLDGEFGPAGAARRSDLAALGGPRAAASGESWDADFAPRLDALLALTPFPVVASEPSARLRLAEATVTAGGAAVRALTTFTTPLRADGPGDAQPEPGSSLRVECEMSGVPGQWHRTGASSLRGTLELVAGTERMRVRCAGTLDRRRTASAGGEIPPVPADDPARGPRVRFARRSGWRAGDAFVEEGRDVRAGVATPVDAKGREGAPETTRREVAWTAVHTCRETDETGAPRRFAVEFRAWRSEDESGADESLRGVVVEFRPRRGWAVGGEGAKPSKRALDWLREEFGRASADDPFRAAFAPSMHVGTGSAWCPDDREVRDAIVAWLPLPVSAETLAASGELESVEVEGAAAVATVRYTCDAPLAFGDGIVREAGSVTVEGVATGSIAEWDRTGGLDETTRVAADLPERDGAIRRMELTRTRSRARSPVLDAGPDARVR